MVKAQCLWDVTIEMNSSIDSTNILVTNLKPLYWALWSPPDIILFGLIVYLVNIKKSEKVFVVQGLTLTVAS